MYDAFSSDYDKFVNWPSRLGYELPFIEGQLIELAASQPDRPVRVLDAACGTGMHAIALAQHGYTTAGADLSAGMVAQAQINATSAGIEIPFTAAGFGELEGAFKGQPLFPFDTVLCLGNSLPHLLSKTDLSRALSDLVACLRPGGLLLVQNRNFDAVMLHRERWMEPQSHRAGSGEWIFLRFYDYHADDLIDFNILTLKREGEGAWSQRVTTTRLRPLLQSELFAALEAVGLNAITCFGDMRGSDFNAEKSGNLIMTARKTI